MVVGVNSRVCQRTNTGIAYFTRYLYGQLNQRGHHLYHFYQTASRPELGPTTVKPMVDRLINNAWFDQFAINRLLRRTPGIAVFHGPANSLPWFKIKHVRYVLTVHDISFVLRPKDYPRSFHLYYRPVFARSLKNADLIVADSSSTKADLVKHFQVDPAKVLVVYLGLPPKYGNQSKVSSPFANPYILSVSTHPSRKNIEGSLRALAAAGRELRHLQYVLAGAMSPIQTMALRDLATDLGLANRMHILGYVDDDRLENLYRHARLLLFPSFYEGFGLPVVEAMAAGCPVITSNVSSLPELVPNRDWLVDPDRPEEIARALVRLVKLSSTERNDLIERNRQFAQRFNWDQAAAGYETAFATAAR